MVLTQRSELLVKAETTPGTAVASFSASDHVEVLNLEPGGTGREFGDRRPASATLSRRLQAVGSGTLPVTFGVDFRGSGTAATVPEWGKLLLASGMKTSALLDVQFAAAIGKAVYVGDTLTGGTSGAIGIVAADHASSATLVRVLKITTASFSTGETVTATWAGSLGALHGATPQVLNTGWAWQPATQHTVSLETTGSPWSGGDPAVGESVLSTTSGGVPEGGGIVAAISGTSVTLEYTWGTFSDGSALASSGGSSETVASPSQLTQVQRTTVTARPNRAGITRQSVGARADVSIEIEGGAQGRFNFSLLGKVGTVADSALTPSITLPSTTAPRLQGGTVIVDGFRIPVHSVTATPGNSVTMGMDGNQSEGDSFAEIGDRLPRITLVVDQLGTATINWDSKRDTPTQVALGFGVGTVAGNRVAVAARKCQVVEVADGEVDGKATHTITLEPQEDVSGDDEFAIFHT